MEIAEKEFSLFVNYVKENYGINLIEKKQLVATRLQNIVYEKGFQNYTDYYRYIISDKTGESTSNLINKLTTNHTFFLREFEHFKYFKENVLPVLSKTIKNKDLRIWSAGCSSGEEPYTIAMILNDFFAFEKLLWDTKILATDISKNVLDIANKGIYTNEQVASIPEHWKKRYFKKINDDNYAIVDNIKNEVIFRRFNLNNNNFNFKKKFHVIFCRNVMIYFDSKTKKELINRFYDITEPGGYLFIGHSESIGKDESKYNYIIPAVYKK